jgi:hypothetical protein
MRVYITLCILNFSCCVGCNVGNKRGVGGFWIGLDIIIIVDDWSGMSGTLIMLALFFFIVS